MPSLLDMIAGAGEVGQAEALSESMAPPVLAAFLKLQADRAKSAITAPRDAYTGELQMWNPETGNVSDAAMSRAGEMAGLAMGGSLPMSRPAGSLGTFAGRLSKTADQDALARAESMLASGADRQAVWDQTGWFKGADGQMRYEIPDGAAKIGPKALEELTAGDGYGATQRTAAGALHHSDLYAAYPELRQTSVDARYNDELPRHLANAEYRHRSDGNGDRAQINLSANSLDGDMGVRPMLLHEMQHGIQAQEGFASGGDPRALARRLPDPDELSDAQLLAGMARTVERPSDVYAKFYRLTGREPRGNAIPIFEQTAPEQLRSMPTSGMDAYRRLAGEVEARNVEARRNMSPEELRAQPPWMTQDVADEHQIVNLGMGLRR